jgi:hypothetical protein
MLSFGIIFIILIARDCCLVSVFSFSVVGAKERLSC